MRPFDQTLAGGSCSLQNPERSARITRCIAAGRELPFRAERNGLQRVPPLHSLRRWGTRTWKLRVYERVCMCTWLVHVLCNSSRDLRVHGERHDGHRLGDHRGVGAGLLIHPLHFLCNREHSCRRSSGMRMQRVLSRILSHKESQLAFDQTH